jgi:hypothetical protein
MEEIWKDIKGFEGKYSISNFGNVKSLSRKASISNGNYRIMKEKVMKPQVTWNGYHAVVLNDGERHKMYKIHRLVAIHFIANNFNQNEINHIDGNKLNNHISNLEWSNRSKNIKHSYDNGLRHFNEKMKNALHVANCKKVICTKSGIIYNSINEAADSIGMMRNTLGDKLRNRRRNNTTLKYL